MTDRPIPPELPPTPSQEGAASIPPVPQDRAYDRGERAQAPQEPPTSGVLYGRLAVGVGVIALGLLNFFPQILQEIAHGEIWRLWPLILMGFGIFKFAKARSAKERHGAAWLIGAGAVLLIHFLGLFGLTWGTGWPLWILVAGLIDLSFPDKPRDRPIGIFLIALGTFLLLARLDLLSDQWYRAWPLLVILFGVVLVWQALFTRPASGDRCRGKAGQRREEGSDHG